jgi:pyruvate kinase
MLKVHVVGDILVQGRGAGNKPGYGTVKIVNSVKEANEVLEKGDILVVKNLDREYISVLDRVSGIIAEQGGLTSHLAIECITEEIPLICNAGGATEVLKTGAFVTLDVIRGIVYNGRTNIM